MVPHKDAVRQWYFVLFWCLLGHFHLWMGSLVCHMSPKKPQWLCSICGCALGCISQPSWESWEKINWGLNLAGQHLLHTAHWSCAASLILNYLSSFSSGAFCCELWVGGTEIKLLQWLLLELSLLAPGQSPCFHVGGQASKQVPPMVLSVLCQPLELLPPQWSPVLSHWGMNFPFGGWIFPYSVGNVDFLSVLFCWWIFFDFSLCCWWEQGLFCSNCQKMTSSLWPAAWQTLGGLLKLLELILKAVHLHSSGMMHSHFTNKHK